MSASSGQDRLLSQRSGCYQKPSSQQPCALLTTLLARGTKCTPRHPTRMRTSCDFNHLHANKLGERRPTGFRSMILCALRMANLPGFSSLSPLHPTPQLNCSFSLSTSQSHCVFPDIQRASSSSDLFPNKIKILIFIPGSLQQQKLILRLRRGRRIRTYRTSFFRPLRPQRPDAIPNADCVLT